jgi:hypothetical protein
LFHRKSFQDIALRVGQAGQRRHIDLALPRILHQSILDAVDGIALLDNLRLDAFQRLVREDGGGQVARIGECGLDVLDELRTDSGEVVGRRTGDDPVEVVG